MKNIFFIGVFCLFLNDSIAQRAKNGTYTATATNTVVNSYTTMTVNANANQTSIAVNDGLLTNSVLTTALAPGDLLLVIQMQGASLDIDVTATVDWGGSYTSAIGHAGDWFNFLDIWGQVTNYNQAGKYEYVQVASVSGTTINLTCGLKNSYIVTGKVQVIRVPRFSQLTINAAASIVPTSWNGSTGVVVAIEVDGNLAINAGGKIEANGRGFRGGQQIDNVSITAGAGSVNDTPYPATSSGDQASEKGEGIGGYTSEYIAQYSRYGVSAPANGGGGANHHNSGGGGGSNVGSGVYTGKGVPNPTYNSFWNLESTPIGGVNSAGGGRGGYSYSNSNQNEAVLGPNQLPWSGDYRRNNGGLGGKPLAFDATRVFMGGGGGAGDQDNNFGGPGGTGGGIVMLQVFGTISGQNATTCTIEANGANGIASNASNLTATFAAKFGNDGGGGGGGGGAIIISNNGTVPSGIGLFTRGGAGGNQNLSVGPLQTVNEADGPGGGGAGGQISITAGSPSTDISGGINGITNSTQVNAFPPNGATSGGSGLSNNGVNFYDLTAQNASICGSGSVTLTVNVVGTLPAGATVGWYTNQFSGSAFHSGLTYTTPNLNASTTYYVGICPGSFRKPIQVTVGASPAISGTAVITNVSCAGNDGAINGLTVSGGSPSYTFSWNGNATASANLINANAGNYILTVTDANGCSATSGPHAITNAVGPLINASLVTLTNPTCVGGNGSITGITQSGGITTSWSNSGGTSINANNLNAGSYTLTVTDASNCTSTAGPYVLTSPSGPTIDATNVSLTNENCGNGNGSISGIIANGVGLTYSWTNTSQTVLDITNLSAGSYTLTVLDNQGCSTTSGPYLVGLNSSPSIDIAGISLVAETCGLNNGSISGIQILGGLAPITYSWTNTAQTTLNISNLNAGNYTLTVLDGNGCSAISNSFSIVDTPMPTIIDINILLANESCAGNDGAISGITATGTGLTYTWNGVAGTLNQNNLVANSYSLTITDVNGCSVSSGPYIVAGSAPLIIDITNTIATSSACTTNTGTISGILIIGGINPVFSWSNGSTSLNQTGLGAGAYIISVTDDQGCTDAETINITLNSGPSINSAAVNVIQTSCGQNNGEILGLVDNSINSTYSWSGSTVTTLNISDLTSGTYNLTATGADGCVTQYGPVTINSSTMPNADFTYSPIDVNPGDLVQFSDLSSTDVVTWDWQVDTATFIIENPSYVFVTEGTYQVILLVTDGNGCSAEITKIIAVYNELIIPNVITTNGDGNNDKFEIKGLEKNTLVQILNRWGDIVFKSDNYLNDWKGQDMNGNTLSNGVYTYYVKTPKGDIKQGFVHLIY